MLYTVKHSYCARKFFAFWVDCPNILTAKISRSTVVDLAESRPQWDHMSMYSKRSTSAPVGKFPLPQHTSPCIDSNAVFTYSHSCLMHKWNLTACHTWDLNLYAIVQHGSKVFALCWLQVVPWSYHTNPWSSMILSSQSLRLHGDRSSVKRYTPISLQ